jgi:hypothetical protein
MVSDRHHRVLSVSTLILLLAPLAFPQGHNSTRDATSAVSGVVTDSDHNVIPGAEVTFQRDSDTSITHTDRNGSINLRLASGRYVVTINKPRFMLARVNDFRVQAPAPSVLNVVLRIGEPHVIIEPNSFEIPTEEGESPDGLSQIPLSGPSSFQNLGQIVESINVRLEVTTSKKIYSVGESIKWRATLINNGDSGSTAFYVSKKLGYAGGNIPGFDISVRQLSGRPPKGPGCAWAGDAFRRKDHRNSAEILKEDFILLQPGSFVGFGDGYSGCSARDLGPGNYEITAFYYSAPEVSLSDPPELRVPGAHILKGKFKSAPFVFTIR